MRLSALAGALLLGFAALLPAWAADTAVPASTPAPAAQKVTLLLDWFVNPVHAAIVVAKEKGFFARAGLDVSFVEPADPSMPPRLVAAGQGDIALTYQPNFYLDVAAGLPIQRIGTSIQTPLNTVMVLADGPIKSLADLKGKTVGYSVAGYETALLGTMLESAGLKLDDVKLINVNFALTQPLIGGQVDAVVGAYRNVEFFEMQLAGHPGRLFFPEEHGVPPYDESIFVTQSDKVHAPFVKPFLDAVGQAQLYILDYPRRGLGCLRPCLSEARRSLEQARLGRHAAAPLRRPRRHRPGALSGLCGVHEEQGADRPCRAAGALHRKVSRPRWPLCC